MHRPLRAWPSKYVFDLGGKWKELSGAAGCIRCNSPWLVVFIILATAARFPVGNHPRRKAGQLPDQRAGVGNLSYCGSDGNGNATIGSLARPDVEPVNG